MPEEESNVIELETVAQDLEKIEAEPGINPYGESITEEALEEESTTIDYYALASEAIERAELERLEEIYNKQEEITLSVEEIFNLDSEIIEISPAQQMRAPVMYSMPEAEAYLLELDNREVYAWFPSGSRLELTDEGYIYNATGNSITGVIADNLNGININGYNDFVTVAPLLATSSNNNAYRYGSRVYVTDYYVSGSNLVNSVSYVSSAKCLQEPGAGYGWSSYQTFFFGFALVLLVLLLIRWGRKL